MTIQNLITYTLCVVFAAVAGIITSALLVLSTPALAPIYDFVFAVFLGWFTAGGWLAADELIHGDDKDENTTTTAKNKRS